VTGGHIALDVFRRRTPLLLLLLSRAAGNHLRTFNRRKASRPREALPCGLDVGGRI
jgi:hypothetical protein